VALVVINQGVDPKNVFALTGGFEAWTKAGYPTASGY
jgi:rhodanese-related sulfurtransferase